MAVSPNNSTAAVQAALAKLGETDAPGATAVVCRALAHEVKNALNPMNLQLALLRRKTEDLPELSRLVNALTQSVHKLDRIMETAQEVGQRATPPGGEDAAFTECLDRVSTAFRADPSA